MRPLNDFARQIGAKTEMGLQDVRSGWQWLHLAARDAGNSERKYECSRWSARESASHYETRNIKQRADGTPKIIDDTRERAGPSYWPRAR